MSTLLLDSNVYLSHKQLFQVSYKLQTFYGTGLQGELSNEKLFSHLKCFKEMEIIGNISDKLAHVAYTENKTDFF